MNYKDIIYTRLIQQHIAQPRFSSPKELVGWMGAMQAQDFAGVKWSLGLRLPGTTDAAIEQAFNTGQIVRTWPMRGTLHCMLPEDIHWMQALLTPRIVALSAGRHRQLELDDKTLQRAMDIITQSLAGGKQLIRKELMDILEVAGISTAGQRGIHIIGWIAHKSRICLGPILGKHQAFVLVDEWAPHQRQLTRDESLAELAQRYFTSHGPATVKDLAWWSGLTVTDAKAALELVKPHFINEVIDGKEYWMTSIAAAPSSPAAFLLPGFDEYLLGYTDRSAALHADHAQFVVPGKNGVFMPTIVIDGQVTGIWKRPAKIKAIEIDLQPFRPLTKAELKLITEAAKQYGAFIGLPVSVVA